MVATQYTSSNYQKHSHRNPLQRWLIRRFYHTAWNLLRGVEANTILDAGCGEGFTVQALSGQSAGLRPVGLDGNLPALEMAQRRYPQGAWVGGDILALPFAAGSFDLIICTEVLEHLDRPGEGLAELRRVADKYLLVSVPNEPLFRLANFLRGKNMRRWGNDVGHVQHWTASAFVDFLTRHGCTVIARCTSFPWVIALCWRA